MIGKFGGFTGTAYAGKGLPLAAPSVTSGWRSCLGAVLLLIFLIPTTLLFHGAAGDAAERIQLLKNLSTMAGLIFVIEPDNT